MQCSAEQNTSVRIADDSPLLSCLPRFAAQFMNKMRSEKMENEHTETNWTKMEKANGAILERKFGSVKLEKMVSALLQVA